MYTAILHATDLSETHYQMCQQAVDIAKKFHADLYLLHVVETPSSMLLAQGLGFTEIENPTPLMADATTVMAALTDSLKLPKHHCFVESGSVKRHILQKAADLNCQLIIVGQPASALMDEAPCDVLVLR